jgi:hypothetical protein
MRIFDTNIWHRIVYTLGAPAYNILTRGFRRRRRRSIEAAGIDPGERILLVGAGTGLDLDFIPRRPDCVSEKRHDGGVLQDHVRKKIDS